LAAQEDLVDDYGFVTEQKVAREAKYKFGEPLMTQVDMAKE